MDLMREITRIAGEARSKWACPRLEPDFVCGLLRTLSVIPMDLGQEQRSALDDWLDHVVRPELEALDLANSIPTERWHLRRTLPRELRGFLDEVVDEEDRSRLAVFFEFAESFFGESYDSVGIGFYEQRPEAEIVEKIVSVWQGAFSLEDDQLTTARRLARSFFAEAKDILQGSERNSLEEKLVLMDEITVRQVEHELRLLPILTAPQRERLREAFPIVIFFQRGGRDETQEHRSSLF